MENGRKKRDFINLHKVGVHTYRDENGQVTMDKIRRDLDSNEREVLIDGEDMVLLIDWWEMLALDEDMTVSDLGNLKIMDNDGVHLNIRAN